MLNKHNLYPIIYEWKNIYDKFWEFNLILFVSNLCQILAKSSKEVVQSSYDVYHVLAQSSKNVVQSSYDMCHVSAKGSKEVPQSSYSVCHVSAQSS